MTGSEVETTVEASIDTNMPRRRPERASSTWRWFILGASRASAEGEDMVILRMELLMERSRRRRREKLTNVNC